MDEGVCALANLATVCRYDRVNSTPTGVIMEVGLAPQLESSVGSGIIHPAPRHAALMLVNPKSRLRYKPVPLAGCNGGLPRGLG